VRKAFLAIGLAAALIPAMAISASAGAPTTTTFHSEGTDVPVEDCGSFTALLTFSHDETITTFYDKAGTLIKEQIRFNFSGTFKNSVTEKSAYEQGAYTIIIDFTGGDAKVVGLVLLIRLPGSGVVTLELGQVTFENGTTTTAGAPEILDGGSFICSLLS
jgi:hypothetical protein